VVTANSHAARISRAAGLGAALLVAGACAAGPSATVTPSVAIPSTSASSRTAAVETAPMNSPTPGASVPAEVIERIIEVTGSISPVHDPAIARDGSTYFLFTTGAGIPFRCSDDLREWRGCGQVFLSTPDWAREAVPGVGDLWAPDIREHDGRFFLYYSASTFGSNHSAIGLATNVTLDPDSPDYEWRDEGLVIASDTPDHYNAIDPNLIVEGDRAWLAFGSFWSGIKLVEVDPATGKPAADAELIGVADNLPHPQNAIEAPFITRHGDAHYLFVSHDFCCRGVDSTYNIRVGRSEAVNGPYVDRDGEPLVGGGGTLVYGGSERWRGAGHNAILVEDDTWYLVFHAYDAEAAGAPTLRIETLIWDADGWPVSPSALAGI
jgi:arabinan endo-1,5-alpha-L-arabinosidase